MINGKFVCLETFCGCGASAYGYALAGFTVWGSDYADFSAQFNRAGPDQTAAGRMTYLGTMQWDEALLQYGGKVDLLHGSPPCQHYSGMSNSRPGLSGTYPDMIAEVRQAFNSTGLPWILENVVGSPLIDPITMCAWSMGRDLIQHHWFESGGGLKLTAPPHLKHTVPASKAGHWRPGTLVSVAGHCSPIEECRRVMEVSWSTRDALSEACPPYFTEYLGKQAIEFLETARRGRNWASAMGRR